MWPFKRRQQPVAAPKVGEPLTYAESVVARLNALDAEKAACCRKDNPYRIKDLVILDHEMNQIIRQALDNGLIPTFDSRRNGWKIFEPDATCGEEERA